MIDMRYEYGVSIEDCTDFTDFIYSELGKNQFLDIDAVTYMFTNLCVGTLGKKAESANIISLSRWLREYIYTNTESKYKISIR